MKNYFYTDKTNDDKIYVFKNGVYVNQLIRIDGKYYWVSLNRCDWNYGDNWRSRKEAIEDAMYYGADVYQLDTVEELADFIKEGL